MLDQNYPEFLQRQADSIVNEWLAAPRRKQKVEPFVKVPTRLLGKVLDHGKPSAYAAHLLAIKCDRPDHVLNERNLGKKVSEGGFGICRRSFQQGIRVMKESGVLYREQIGRRSFAKERLAEGGEGFVPFPRRLIREDSPIVAGVLAVLLSPYPVRPKDVFKRIGIRSRETTKKLTELVIATGAVAHHVGKRGAVWLGRSGANFNQADDLTKNEPIKNDPTKNEAAQNTCEETGKKREIRQKGKNSPHTTRLCERACADDDLRNGSDLDPQWITLRDWRSSSYLAELDYDVYGGYSGKDWFTLNNWRHVVEHYGEAPAHVLTPAAHRQALEICDLLSRMNKGHYFDGDHAKWALAFEIAKAAAKGRKIRSLGFIAERLCRSVVEGDYSCIFNLPPRIDQAEFESAYNFALEAFAAFEKSTPPFKAVRDTMLSTPQLELLAAMFREHGRNVVVQAINKVLREGLRPPEGRFAWRWSWFDDAIALVKQAMRPPKSRKPRKRKGAPNC